MAGPVKNGREEAQGRKKEFFKIVHLISALAVEGESLRETGGENLGERGAGLKPIKGRWKRNLNRSHLGGHRTGRFTT